jgi:hypothetical protein
MDLLLTYSYCSIAVSDVLLRASRWPTAQAGCGSCAGQRIGGDLAAGADGTAVRSGHGRGGDREGRVHQRGPGRAYSSASGDHFYTTSAAERDNAVAKLGYLNEGVACHVYPEPVTR